MEEEVPDKYKVDDRKEEPTEVKGSLWNGNVYGKTGSTGYENGEKTAGQEFSPDSEGITCSVCKASRTS